MTDESKEESAGNPLLYVGAVLFGLLIAGVIIFLQDGEVDSAAENEPVDLSEFRPQQEPQDGFVGSESCQECHANQHESWHASYHRTMTQVADTESVIGSFNGEAFEFPGVDGLKHFSPRRADGQFWVEFDSTQDFGQPGERHTLPVVMTTGSHHMQAYWVSIGHGRTVGLFPLVYLKADQRWVPRRAAFLGPPTLEFSMELARWDMTCIRCHTTGGRPHEKLVSGRRVFDSSASEFGISCESCHGKAEEHVRLRREERAGGKPPEKDPIVNPSELSPQRSAQVCGACHSFTEFPDPHYHHQPGSELLTNGVYILGLDQASRDQIALNYPDTKGEELEILIDLNLRGYFWPDGQVRVVGREYSSIRESSCHSTGTMSCVSCHRLHKSRKDQRSFTEWADDQLEVGMRTDQACLQCHEAKTFAATEHTHHPMGSSGSACMNCHMPNTTYGLLKATRNHTVFSPNISKDLQADRPNACNLCHLDQSVAWSAFHLKEWYQHDIPPLEPQWTNTAASIVWALRGDAHVRALAAWHLGWKPAQEAVKSKDWMPPMLAALMNDPYDAVRYIAHKSLLTLPEYRKFEFDYVGPTKDRAQRVDAVLRTWQQRPRLRNRPDLLLDARGHLDQAAFNRNLEQRDTRRMHLLE